MGVLAPPPAPQKDYANQSENCPASPPKLIAPRANLSADQAQQPRNHHRRHQQRPKNWFSNEHKAARIPARIEWKKWPQPIVVCPVEQQVAQSGNECGQIEPTPAQSLCLQPVRQRRVRIEPNCRQLALAPALK